MRARIKLEIGNTVDVYPATSMKRGFAGTNKLGLVGAKGFEPPTPASRTQCATGLRYAPTGVSQREEDCLTSEGRNASHERRRLPTGDFSLQEIHTVGQARISTYGGLHTRPRPNSADRAMSHSSTLGSRCAGQSPACCRRNNGVPRPRHRQDLNGSSAWSFRSSRPDRPPHRQSPSRTSSSRPYARDTSFGALAPGTNTAPISRSAATTDSSIDACVEARVTMRP